MSWEITTTWGGIIVNKDAMGCAALIFCLLFGLVFPPASLAEKETSLALSSGGEAGEEEAESPESDQALKEEEKMTGGLAVILEIDKGEMDALSSGRSPAAKKTQKTRIQRGRSLKIPSVAAPPKKRAKRLSLRAVQPPSNYSRYYAAGTDEAELEDIQNQEINHLFRLLQKNKDPELILRLGSVYKEKAQFISYKLHVDFDRKMDEFKRGARKTRPRLNLSAAGVYNRKALKLFQNFKRNYPRHKRIDEVLYHLGFHSYQLGVENRGSLYFAELEKRFPKSVYLYEARFQLGEHFFKKEKWKESFSYYSKVAANKKGRFYFFALYKMAWANYKRGRAQSGLALLERIIRESRRMEEGSEEAVRFTFASEAIEDLTLFYTYSRRPPGKAKDYFLSLLGRKAWPLLKKLAYIYRDAGKSRGAISLFEALIRRDPEGPEASDYQYQIIDSLYGFGNTAAILKETRKWARKYGPGGAWAQANRRDSYLIRKTNERIEVTLRKYALENHQSFRRSRSQKAKILALNFYRIYFSHFKKSKFTDQIHFFYGELLFDLRNYRQAAAAYDYVIVNHPKSKYAEPSYTNQLLALEKALPDQKKLKAMTAGRGESPVEFPSSVKRFISASLRYLKKFPNEKNSSSILYRVAAFHYNFKQLSAAAKYFQAFSERYPKSPLMSNVGGILLDIYNKNKNYRALEKLAAQFARSGNVDKSLVKEARLILEQLSFKKAQDLSLKKNYRESAGLYEKFAKDRPSAALAAVAWYNAGLNYEKARDMKKAAAMYAAVLRYDPKKYGSIQKKSRGFLPVLQEKLGFYKQAADSYASYARSYPKSSKAADYWYNAGVIFDALNQVSDAVHSYTKYRTLQKGGERHKALFLIGLLYERRRQWRKAIEHYGYYLNTSSPEGLSLIQASFRTAEIYRYRLNSLPQAETWYRRTMNLHKKLGAGISYAARSHFALVRKHYEEFQKASIPANPRLQEAAIAKKIKLLRQLEERLKPVIRYDDGERIIASLSLIGKANREMAASLYNAPLPKGLDKAGKKQYREGVKKLITPYVQDAVKNYRLAIEKSKNFKIYSEGLGEAHKGLASIKMSEGRFEGFLPEPVLKEVLPFAALDSKGIIARGLLSRLNIIFENDGISESEFRTIASASKSRKEKKMLAAVSNVLNKDPDNLTAIKSLAVFYLNNKRPQMGALILSRLLSKRKDEPSLLNNLGVAAVRRGEVREAVSYFKKALGKNPSYPIARLNLASVFVSSYDYHSAYPLYRSSYKKFLETAAFAGRREKAAVLNNYGVALAGVQKWKLSVGLFKKLSSESSPKPEILLNYGIALTEAPFDKSDYVKAKGLVDELHLYPRSSKRFKRKLAKLSKKINQGLRQKLY